ncbi:MAG TPA: hypothetical protein VF668_16900 [Pyrinomonadaceae bacterium]|jgi:hypothetical protein
MRGARPSVAARALRALAGALALALAHAAAARPAGPAHAFRPAQGVPADAPAAFEFEMNGFAYRVASNGNGRRTKGDRTRHFNLRLEGQTRLGASVYFAEYEGDLLLAYEVTDGVNAGGRVTRLLQPSMRALWNANLPRGRPGPPAREGRFLYLTAAGFVGRLDLAGGAWAWSHDDLLGRGREGAFASFAAPEPSGDEVLFREAPVYNGRALTVFAEKRSGKIKRVE